MYHELGGTQIPMSIQQSYEMFFKTSSETDPNDVNQSTLQLDDYKIYSYLVRLGYILRRVPLNEITEQSSQKSPKPNQASADLNLLRPLVNSEECSTLNASEIFNRLNSLIPNIKMKQVKEKLAGEQLKSDFRLLFDAYQPDKSFKKSKPIREPSYRILTSLTNKLIRWPNLNDFLVNDLSVCNEKNKNTKYLYAFVDNGDVLFYSFNLDFDLPSLFNNSS